MKFKCVHCDEDAIVCVDDGPLCVDHLHEYEGDDMEDEQGEPWGV